MRMRALLLDAVVSAPVDDDVRERIIAEARGNPLALLELPFDDPQTRLASGLPQSDLPDVSSRVQTEYQNRADGLPEESRLLLLLAAADPTGDPLLLRRAADHSGIEPESAAPAESAGLIELGTRVRFRHPLARSAIYRAADPADRRRAHAALAAVTDPESDPDRRAWHAAQATAGVDERVAAELERSATRARARGGYAAAGSFLLRATQLTPEPATRARRALDAAHATHEAGDSETALDLLATTDAGPIDDFHRARSRPPARADLVPADPASAGARDAAACGGRHGAVRSRSRARNPSPRPRRGSRDRWADRASHRGGGTGGPHARARRTDRSTGFSSLSP